jgi:hypothetical protein
MHKFILLEKHFQRLDRMRRGPRVQKSRIAPQIGSFVAIGGPTRRRLRAHHHW